MYRDNNAVEDTIQNGVKETKRPLLPRTKRVEDAIENGVKDTGYVVVNIINKVEDAIEYGVKKTYSTLRRTKLGVDDIIRNGVKDTKPMDEWVNAESIVEDTIEYGVKEIQPLPAQDGNRDWGNYYHGKEDRTKPFNEYLDEAIRFGVKEVIEENHHRTREVIITIKDGVKETYDDCSDNIARVEGIIRVGKKLDKDGI
jgi:tartrate dehydratase alpha subunit/fumarate hydratase class I-like protein